MHLVLFDFWKSFRLKRKLKKVIINQYSLFLEKIVKLLKRKEASELPINKEVQEVNSYEIIDNKDTDKHLLANIEAN